MTQAEIKEQFETLENKKETLQDRERELNDMLFDLDDEESPEEAQEMRDEIEKIQEDIEEIDNQLKELAFLFKMESVVEGVREMLDSAKKSFDGGQEVGLEVVRFLISSFIKCKEEMEPELDKLSLLEAKAMKRDLDNLKKAGFKDDEAFTIFMAKIKPTSLFETITGFFGSVGTGVDTAQKAKTLR